MKIKIALLGLFFGNGITHPTYADRYGYQLEADEADEAELKKGDLETEEVEKDEDEAKSENLIKLGATVSMGPTIVHQDQVFLFKDSLRVGFTCKADVPKAWCTQDAKVNIGASWKEKSFALKNATVAIGEMLKMGYTSSIFGYEKADSAFLIAPCATVFQIQYEGTFDWFRMRAAIERPIPLQVGLFDRNRSEGAVQQEGGDKKEKAPANELDEKNKGSFKIKNSIPTLGLSLAVIADQLNIGLSGLGRLTDYTYSTSPNAKNLERKYFLTYGVDLGVQYQVVPKKITVTGQASYVKGLGDYLSGLAAIQGDEGRKEMCAAYYINNGGDQLSSVDAWGVGVTLAYCVMPKWTYSIAGSYLTGLEDPQKPPQAFSAQWNLSPSIDYKVNKYFTFSTGYSLVKEFKIDQQKNKGVESTFSGSLKFSL